MTEMINSMMRLFSKFIVTPLPLLYPKVLSDILAKMILVSPTWIWYCLLWCRGTLLNFELSLARICFCWSKRESCQKCLGGWGHWGRLGAKGSHLPTSSAISSCVCLQALFGKCSKVKAENSFLISSGGLMLLPLVVCLDLIKKQLCIVLDLTKRYLTFAQDVKYQERT